MRDPYTIHTDASITRRKRYHLVIDGDFQTVYRARLFHEILDWLYDHDVLEAKLVAEDQIFPAKITLSQTKKDP